MSAVENSASPQAVPALTARGISKQFGPRLVLDRLDLQVAPGEVHALLGANGSGKSTFVKIISGNQPPTAADELSLGGEGVELPSTVPEMQTLGLRVVHQDLGLLEELSIAENIGLSRHFVRARGGRIAWPATRRLAQSALDAVGLPRASDELVKDLAAWERVAVVFAASLYGGVDQVRLLVLDEITAALPSEEVARVMQITERLKASGTGVLYVTHRFEEVFQIADTISVLRDGKLIHRSQTSAVTPDQLVELVAGRSLDMNRKARTLETGTAPAIQFDNVSNGQLADVSFTVRAGEIVGVVGRAGCGRSAIGRTAFGLQDVGAGSVLVSGAPLPKNRPWAARKAGIGYVGQDRKRAGSIPGATVEENLSIASLDSLTTFGWIRSRSEHKLAEELIDECQVQPPDRNALIEQLSGGNQQKCVVGRWIPTQPKVLILDEPTEGVDVGARQGIYDIIRRETSNGCAVLVLSSSIEELVLLCDRVLLMVEGRVTGEISGEQMSIDTIERFLLFRDHPDQQSESTTVGA
jgi:ribose transport system ATP-binding protein